MLFLKGEKEPAIELQQKAVELAEGGRKRQFQKNLDDYKANRVPNETQIGELRQQINNNIQQKEWDKAASALGELEKLLPPEEREKIVRRTPLGRLAEVGDVVPAVMWLATGRARFVTGHVLVVDGGLSA